MLDRYWCWTSGGARGVWEETQARPTAGGAGACTCAHAPHLAVVAHRGVQVQVTSDDVELDPQQKHQHAGAVDGHDGAAETWSASAVGDQQF